MITFIFALGLIFGSFLSVCIFRIPRGKGYIEYLFSVDEEGAQSDLATDSRINDSTITDSTIKDNTEITKDVTLNSNTSNSNNKESNTLKPLSLIDPLWSMCTACEIPLKWYHNIPLLSYILQLGKCSCKKTNISARYPLIEIVTGITALLCYGTYGINITSFLVFIFCCALIVTTFIDYDFFIIPNSISIPGFLLGILIAIVNTFTHIFSKPIVADIEECLYGVLSGAGFLWLVATIYLKLRKKDGLGFGDVKLLAMVGAFFGPECALQTIFVGSFFGSILGVGGILLGKKNFSQKLPFGPYLAFGTYFYLFVGIESVTYLLEKLLID